MNHSIWPSQNFGDVVIQSTIETAKWRRRQCNSGISNPRCLVVVYGTGKNDEKGSQIAVCRLKREVGKMGMRGEIIVKLLKGGMKSWNREYGWDRQLVADFEYY